MKPLTAIEFYEINVSGSGSLDKDSVIDLMDKYKGYLEKKLEQMTKTEDQLPETERGVQLLVFGKYGWNTCGYASPTWDRDEPEYWKLLVKPTN